MEFHKVSSKEYQMYINEKPNISGIFHNSWWLELFKKWYHHKYWVDYYAVYDGASVVALMPVPVHRKFLVNIIASPILTPYLGPVFLKNALQGKRISVLSRIKDVNSIFTKVLKSYFLTFYYPFAPWHVDLQSYKWEGFGIGVKYTYLLDLGASHEELWERMDKKRRNEIRKAGKLNPEIVFNDLDSFTLLNNKTFKRQNKRLNLEPLWKTIFKECSARNQCRIWTAYVNRTPTASLFLIWDNERAYYIGGGIDENSQGTMSLLMWEAIKFSKELGLNYFDFEGSDVPSIERYFRKFGGEIVPCYYIASKLLRVIK